MNNPFTIVDNSIDIVGAVFFAMCIFWASHYLFKNNLWSKTKIIYVVVIIISAAHIYQVITQVIGQSFASFRIWDFINYATALFNLMVVHWIFQLDKKTKR